MSTQWSLKDENTALRKEIAALRRSIGLAAERKPLTRRQSKLLMFVTAFISEHGYAPRLEQIGRALGLSSLATIPQAPD